MLLKLLISPVVWHYLANCLGHVIGRTGVWLGEVYYVAAEVEPGGEGT